MTTTEEATLALEQLGFAMTSDIPAGRVEDDWPCVSYNVSLVFKGKHVLHTPFRLGIGHVNIKKARPDSICEHWTNDEASMIYAWQRNPSVKFKDPQNQANIAAKLARKQGVKPNLAEVLHCLVMDGEAFFQAQSFEQWAAEFGYDLDSRKAEGIYRTCDATGRKLAGALSKETLDEVRRITQDL